MFLIYTVDPMVVAWFEVLAKDLIVRWLQKAMATVLTEEERAGLAIAAQSVLKLSFHEKDPTE